MEAIILAGGFGTRLRNVVSDVPKPMAPMDDRKTPFLSVIMKKLKKKGINHIVLSTGYKSQIIEDFFQNQYYGISIDYSIENEPLLTGGAVKFALRHCDNDNVFVFNGDTYFDVNLHAMIERHVEMQSDFTIAIKKIKNIDRYGTVDINNGRIVKFIEKKHCDIGWINGGVYCLKHEIFSTFPVNKFSLEKDYLERKVGKINLYSFKSKGYFIDIGIPFDYELARKKYANNKL